MTDKNRNKEQGPVREKRITRQQNKSEKPEMSNELTAKVIAKPAVFPTGMRVLIFILICVVATIAGSMIGYGVIGDGNPFGVFNPSTWTHIFDIMNGKVD